MVEGAPPAAGDTLELSAPGMAASLRVPLQPAATQETRWGHSRGPSPHYPLRCMHARILSYSDASMDT